MADPEPPRNVKELLVEAKDVSELMVDLAYGAVFFNEEDLAEEVEKLEDRMDGYLRRLREVAMLAARSPEDAEAMAGALNIAAAIEKIGDAASDMARVIQANLGIPDTLRPDLRHADEIVGRVKVREGSPAVGRSLRELTLPTETGMWLIAVRRGGRRPSVPGARGGRQPDPGARGGAAPSARAGDRGARAHRARPGRGHPGRDEELGRGRSGARVLVAPVQRSRARRRG